VAGWKGDNREIQYSKYIHLVEAKKKSIHLVEVK
jgi:hypothetical protein